MSNDNAPRRTLILTEAEVMDLIDNQDMTVEELAFRTFFSEDDDELSIDFPGGPLKDSLYAVCSATMAFLTLKDYLRGDEVDEVTSATRGEA